MTPSTVQLIHLLDIVPLLHTIYKLLGIFARHTVGIAFAACLDDISVIAHASLEPFDDGCVLGMHQGVDTGYYIFFYVHYFIEG